MVKNPPFDAGDAGLIPGRGTKIPHASSNQAFVLQLLSLCTPAPVLHNKRRLSATTRKRLHVAAKNPGTIRQTQCR